MITEGQLQEITEGNECDFRYYGWRVVLAACLGVMGGFGSLFVYTFTVFVKPLGAQFGWNRESVSLGFAITAMTVGVLFGPQWFKSGPRNQKIFPFSDFREPRNHPN